MIKIGYRKIKEINSYGVKQECINCGETGEYRVSFSDNWGIVKIILCGECNKLEYEDLKVQYRLQDCTKKQKEI